MAAAQHPFLMERLIFVSQAGLRLSRVATSALVLLAIECSGRAMAENAKPAAANSSWVKLCEKSGSNSVKTVCSTFHETLDASTGNLVAAVSIRETEGAVKPVLQIKVPSGMILAAGARVAVMSAAQAELLKKGGALDNKDVKQIDLKYTTCSDTSCTAEVEVPQETLAAMKSGGGLLVRTVYASGQPFAFPFTLAGFTTALTGKPVDNQQYQKARDQLLSGIRKRAAEKKLKTE
jgi:invasion protein IalB